MKLTTEFLKTRQFDYTVTPPEEKRILTIRDHLILSRSNFALITGSPKVGKSTFTTCLLASAIANREIFNMRIHCHPDKQNICLFDTEQAQQDLYKSINRIMYLAQCKPANKFDVYSLRRDDATIIKTLLEIYIQENPETGLIIIDGLLDLVFNFNDEKECKILIDYLKRVTAENDIAIIGILHTGKTTGSSVGHIGSFADRYCQSNLEIYKENDTINLKGKLLRSAPDFERISLMRDANGNLFQTV